MNNTEIKLIKIALDHGIENPTMPGNFEAMGMDSLDMVEIEMAVEEVFNIEFSDEDLEKFESLADIAQHIDKHET